MKLYYETEFGEIYNGKATDMSKWFPAKSVQCCVTSPPYWGLRDYGIEGQFGLEKTPEEYVGNLVNAFRSVWKTLKKDGTLWLNLGDSYVGSTSQHKGSKSQGRNSVIARGTYASVPTCGRKERVAGAIKCGLKPKNLVGIPWRVAFALQADGWCLRQDIIWAKNNPMPESVKDRCTKSHEYIFLLSKSAKYFYNSNAIKERSVTNENRPSGIVRDRIYDYDNKQKVLRSQRDSFKRENSTRPIGLCPKSKLNSHRNERKEDTYDTDYRNKRSVWSINTKPYKEAHFATFPPELPRTCILAGSKEGDTVLDLFVGSGTTCIEALKLNRRFIGVDLNSDYCEIAKQRIANETIKTKGEICKV